MPNRYMETEKAVKGLLKKLQFELKELENDLTVKFPDSVFKNESSLGEHHLRRRIASIKKMIMSLLNF